MYKMSCYTAELLYAISGIDIVMYILKCCKAVSTVALTALDTV